MNYTTSQVIQRLIKRAKTLGSFKALADEIGISPQYLSEILRRRREINYVLADKLGYKKIIRFSRSLKEQTK